MTFDIDQCLLMTVLCDQAYPICLGLPYVLPPGCSAPVLIKAVGTCSLIALKDDPLRNWMFSTWLNGQEYRIARGTRDRWEWILDFYALPTRTAFGGQVHCGMNDLYCDIKPSIAALPVNPKAIYGGHSLGGPISAQAALDFGDPANLTTVESPKWGDEATAERLIGATRIWNRFDLVPEVPDGFGFSHGSQQVSVMVQGTWSLVDPKIAHEIVSVQTGLKKIKL